MSKIAHVTENKKLSADSPVQSTTRPTSRFFFQAAVSSKTTHRSDLETISTSLTMKIVFFIILVSTFSVLAHARAALDDDDRVVVHDYVHDFDNAAAEDSCEYDVFVTFDASLDDPLGGSPIKTSDSSTLGLTNGFQGSGDVQKFTVAGSSAILELSLQGTCPQDFTLQATVNGGPGPTFSFNCPNGARFSYFMSVLLTDEGCLTDPVTEPASSDLASSNNDSSAAFAAKTGSFWMRGAACAILILLVL